MYQENLLTAKEIAKRLQVSKALIYNLISQGQIRSVRFGKTVRVRAEDLDTFIQSNMSGPELSAPVSALSTLNQASKG